jgi:hypothetical protein
MQRRKFFKIAGGTAALMSLPFSLKAAETEAGGVRVTTEIGSNHGHDLVLEVADVIALLKETKVMGPVELDIQGQSGHPHGIVMDEQTLIQILSQESVQIESTNVAGHTHSVNITLSLI